MNLIRLYIENFMCHESSYIDFSQFSSALIIGKVENNELHSNGVGKTTIFISFPLNFHFFADSVQLSLFISLAVIFSTTFII